MEPVHQEIYQGHLIEIHYDDDAFNPRSEYDNFGTMVCWHRRYTLGDEQPSQDPGEWIVSLADQFDDYPNGLEYYLDNTLWQRIVTAHYNHPEYNGQKVRYNQKRHDIIWELIERNVVMLKLFLYDHGGISMSCSSFLGRAQHADWDSGPVGYIYASRADILKEYGGKNLTKEKREKAEKLLKAEVQEYDYYLTGQVYGYQIFELEKTEDDADDLDDGEIRYLPYGWEKGDYIESCWGFLGEMEYCLSEARESVPDQVQVQQEVAC